MGPGWDGFIMNLLEEGALGDPVRAGNLVYNLDVRRTLMRGARANRTPDERLAISLRTQQLAT